ncbi:hypothetical protein HDU96_003937 [Phlyctochytrium bullatum]|nr:hypothetical protein HDU96_003937 [Phlyctochytrium bullatum]
MQIVALLIAYGTAIASAAPAPAPAPAPASFPARPSSLVAPSSERIVGAPIENQYIVLYKDTVPAASIQAHEAWLSAAASGTHPAELQRRGFNTSALPQINAFGGFTFLHKFGNPLRPAASKLRGYAAKISQDIATNLKTLPEIQHVEQDTVVAIDAFQSTAPWGLKRISTASLPLPSGYTYPNTAGTGATVYVIDSGVEVTHPEFQGRAKWGDNFSGDGINTDKNGHGTHVAGTIGSASYGVAKNATIIAVKVLGADGTGDNSNVIAGVNYVATASAAKGGSRTKTVALANMSLGGTPSDALDAAINAALSSGVVFSVSAGNKHTLSCNQSPARVPDVITVAASSITDTFADFSNYGACVDIIAPGVDITSTWFGASTNTISGTSMASPHVAGTLALLLPTQPTFGLASLTSALLAITSPNQISAIPDTATINKLLQVPGTPAGTPRPPVPQCAHSVCVAGVALTCSDACVVKVVRADSYCGSNRWDDQCVDEAIELCGVSC